MSVSVPPERSHPMPTAASLGCGVLTWTAIATVVAVGWGLRWSACRTRTPE